MQTEENNTEPQKIPVTPEDQAKAAKKFTEKRAQLLSQLTRAHMADYLNTLGFQPGLSGARKVEMITKFLDMVEGVLDYGVDVTKIEVPEKGNIGKKAATIGGILAQAIDNKMILLAQNMQEAENNTTEEKIEEQINENKEVNNG